MDIQTKLTIIYVVLSLASRFFCAVAVATDTKLTHIKHDKLCIILVTVLGVTGLGIYFVVRRWLPQEVKFVCTNCGRKAPKGTEKCPKCGGMRFGSYTIENRSEMTTKVIACVVIAIVMLGVREWARNYSPLAEQLQNQYSDFSGSYEDDENAGEWAANGDTHI